MLFDPKPKKRISDVFDRKEEIEMLKKFLNSAESLILVYGLRRMGKTSLILSTLNDLKLDYLFLDVREIAKQKSRIYYKDFLSLLEGEINKKLKKGRFEEFINYLKKIKGVTINSGGISVSFSWNKEERTEFANLLEKLNEWGEDKGQRVIIVIDEAQELENMRDYDLLPAIDYAFDHLDNLSFIITGSEVRVFSKFLRVNDPRSSLYGRAFSEIQLKPFDKDTAISFLEKGFEEFGINFKYGDRIYEEFGGNPGWLTLYGHTAVTLKDFDRAIERTKEIAKGLLKEEFMNFLYSRMVAKDRYIRIIKTCKDGCTWSEIKLSLESLEGRKVNDRTVYTLINNLLDYSFLIKEEKKYVLSDKLLAELF